jgi:hypothetical protein
MDMPFLYEWIFEDALIGKYLQAESIGNYLQSESLAVLKRSV